MPFTNMKTLDEWNQNYQENYTAGKPSFISPGVSSNFSGDGGGLVTKTSIAKPRKRRSRASKKAPTTLLSANTDNFRTLVQQFTGCHSTFGAYKGPINLSFAQYSYRRSDRKEHEEKYRFLNGEPDDHHQSFFSFGVTATSSTTATTATTVTTCATVSLSIPSTGICPRPDHDQLTVDDFELVRFSLQDPSEPGFCSTFPATSNSDQFWGY